MKKSLIILIAVIVILAVSVTSTIAWITSATNTLTNKFTVGDVDITLTEPLWEAETEHLIIPGAALPKDPKVTVNAGSERCYVFIEIITAPDLEFCIDYTVDPTWTALTGETGVYWQEVAKSGSDTVLPVLTGNQVTVPTTVARENLALIETAVDTMKITAYAIQYANITPASTPANAWIILNP